MNVKDAEASASREEACPKHGQTLDRLRGARLQGRLFLFTGAGGHMQEGLSLFFFNFVFY